MEQEKDLIRNKVTICIINYKTEELIKLCLRSIRHFTEYPYEVIVVDNDSKDSSVDYLRSLDWITLIERHDLDMKGGQAHSTALDIGLENAKPNTFSRCIQTQFRTITAGCSTLWITWEKTCFAPDAVKST